MRFNFEIDYLQKKITIDIKKSNIFTEYKSKTLSIDRLITLFAIEKIKKNIYIDRFKYKAIRVNIPYFSDWVILQNDYLPISGEYFLN
jgi:hypothetical protein